ncbi:GNAT family protein [Corallococcus caeni]|uniref:GNAT family N-acetyltransferase n=1 Tax=Corallococcus caeni TaxID=3082388 RepID=UPI00295769C0|nr:GNAT family protein [Corallococcus sp. KH5-1]
MKFSHPGLLSGPRVVLDPLGAHHREPLRAAAARDQSIWTYFPINFNGAGEDFDPWFDYTMERYAKNEHFPFAVRRRADGQIVGTTRFYDAVPDHLRVAIGSTWYAPDARGTLINSEVRLLSLTYAFTRWGVNRVELITDPLNLSSRAAMKILGAVEEGLIRNHLIYKDGRIRDSVLFSIIKTEWPEVERRLLKKLGYNQDVVRLE